MKRFYPIILLFASAFTSTAQIPQNAKYCSKDSLKGFCLELTNEQMASKDIWDCLVTYSSKGTYLQSEDTLSLNLTTLENFVTLTPLNLFSISNIENSKADSLNIVVNISTKERNEPIPFGELFLTDESSFEAANKILSFKTDQMGNVFFKVPNNLKTYFVSTGYSAEYWQFFPFEADANKQLNIGLGDMNVTPNLPLEFNYIVLKINKKRLLLKDLNSNQEILLFRTKQIKSTK